MSDLPSPIQRASIVPKEVLSHLNYEALVKRHVPAELARVQYRPEFAEQVIQAGSDGFTLSGFAGMIGIPISVVRAWIPLIPEFATAVEISIGAQIHRHLANINAKKISMPKFSRDKWLLEQIAPWEFGRKDHDTDNSDRSLFREIFSEAINACTDKILSVCGVSGNGIERDDSKVIESTPRDITVSVPAVPASEQ